MQKEKITKTNNKGITLIALIITIIVMLILVAVTVNVAMNGGLFNTANDAAKDTEKHAIYDQIVGAMQLTNDGKIKVSETYIAAKTTLETQGKTVGELQDDGTFTVTGNKGTYTYTITQDKIIIGGQDENEGTSGETSGEELTTVSHSYYYDETDGDVIKCTEHEDETYTIGDAFDYTPSTENTSVLITGAESGVTRGIEAEDLTAGDFEENGAQTIAQDTTLTWVVFGIDEDTNKLLITSSTPTSNAVTLYGAEAYNNGIDIVNRICGMYSGENATAEGMTIDDVNKFLGYTLPEGKTGICEGDIWVSGTIADTVNIPYTNTNIWAIIQSNANLTLTEGKRITPNGNNTIEALGTYPVDGYSYNEPEITTATITRKNLIFGTNSDLVYLLACHGVTVCDDYVYFGPGMIAEGTANSGASFFSTGGSEDGGAILFRPVISIIPII